MKQPKNIDELIQWINNLTLKDIYIYMAIKDIQLYNNGKSIDMLPIADALTMKASGFKTRDVSAKWIYPERLYFLEFCYQRALKAHNACKNKNIKIPTLIKKSVVNAILELEPI